jgi:hypothetical protein
MCIICIEIQNNKLSPWEAARNLREMIEEISEDHLIEVEEIISAYMLDAKCEMHGYEQCFCENIVR